VSPLPAPDLVLDCVGRPCPVPVIELARALRDAVPGTVVEVVSDDPAALVDIPAFCRMRGHEHLGNVDLDRATGLRVRAVGPGHARPDRPDAAEREHR
jgi:tRNA 2-thiouridine synthesizing protein A